MKSGLSLSWTRSTQFDVLGRDRETGWSIPHLTISSEEGPGAGGHKSFVLVSRPLVYLNVLNQANHKADAHISKISLYRSKVFQAPTKLHKRAFKPETFKVCAKQTDTHK